MEGRKIPGQGLAHEQEYIAERLEQAGDVDEYTEAAEQLEQQANDLKQLNDQADQPNQSQ